MLRRINFSSSSVPLALMAAVILSYGLAIPFLGFFGDDWIYIYNYHLLGAGSFGDFVAVDRPYSAWIYTLITPIFGTQPWPYHLFLLCLRWLSAVLVWWVLRLAWPSYERPAIWAAALFAVYPGFVQQPIAVQFILHFTVLDLFLFSLGASLLAVRRKPGALAWLALGWLGSLSVFSLEYFSGLEFLRPVLLWAALRGCCANARERLKSTLITWLPYLLVLAAFLVWRVLIFKFPTYQPAVALSLLEDPAAGIPALLLRILGDLKTVTYDAWRQVAALPQNRAALPVFAALILGGFALAFGFLKKAGAAGKDGGNPENLSWPIVYTAVGVFALLAAGLPIWPAAIRVELPFPWDRSTLPFMLGSCLLLVGLCGLVIKPGFQIVLVSALVALSFGHHYENGLVYRQEWQNLRYYFWQLSWRMPALTPGTILVSDEIPLYRYSDNDLTPVVNWMYAPRHHDAAIPYKYFDLSTRVGNALPGFTENLPVSHNYRNHNFTGSTSGVLSIYLHQPGCVWVLGPEDVDFPRLPERILETLPISHKAQISAGSVPAAEPPGALGSEPAHSWCYSFEKIDLAVQMQDYRAAVDLAEEAGAAALVPGDALEYLPLVEAYANLQKWDRAGELLGKVMEKEENRQWACSRMKKSPLAFSSRQEGQQFSLMLEQAGCPL